MGPCQYFTTTCTFFVLPIFVLLCMTAGHLEPRILSRFWLLILIYYKHLQCPITYVFQAVLGKQCPGTYIFQALKMFKYLYIPVTYIPQNLYIPTWNFQVLTLSHYNTKPACQYFEKFNSQFAIVWLVVWQPDAAKYAVACSSLPILPLLLLLLLLIHQ